MDRGLSTKPVLNPQYTIHNPNVAYIVVAWIGQLPGLATGFHNWVLPSNET